MRRVIVVLAILGALLGVSRAQVGPLGVGPFITAVNLPATITYVTDAADSTNQTTYTFSGVSYGGAFTGRYLAVCVTTATFAGTISSVTVSGNSASEVYQSTSANQGVAGIFLIQDSTNTSGTIIVTFSGAAQRAGIAVYQINHLLSTTARDSQANSGTPETVSLNVPADGVALGCAVSANGTPSSISYAWSGLTKDSEITVESSGTWVEQSTASKAFSTAQTGLTVTATQTGTVQRDNMIAVSLR